MTQTRRRLTAEERRQAVLEAACREFARSSYRGTTTAELADAAGISEPILYRHFGSKRDLYLACLDHSWSELHAVAERARADDPSGCLGAVANAYMASRSRARLIDLWIQALTVAPEDAVIAKALRRQIREVHGYFAGLIRDAQARGEVFAERDPEAEAWIFVATGLLATVDHRLGGLLGEDLGRVRDARKRWLHG